MGRRLAAVHRSLGFVQAKMLQNAFQFVGVVVADHQFTLAGSRVLNPDFGAQRFFQADL